MIALPDTVIDRPDMREKIHVFAVADAYQQWSDVTETELLASLKVG
ncbi:MAG: hypothetical protein PVI71_01735 [Desulfobacterales bacterium]|jgi:hypothetical protein